MSPITNHQRFLIVSQIMAPLGFRLLKLYPSHRRGGPFTDKILYIDDDSQDTVAVFFPNESESEQGAPITTQAEFRKQIKSPLWNSLEEFGENIEIWLDYCRSAN